MRSKHTPEFAQSQFTFDETGPNPSGLCWCGCGQSVPIAKRTSTRYGLTKGKSTRFCIGHRSHGCGSPYMSLADAFWSRLTPGAPDECWIWPYIPSTSGYGRFSFHGKRYRAHHVAYELAYGPVPNDLQVLHHCDVRNCVNPDHLWLGTNTDNNRDMLEKGRHADLPGELNGNAKLTEADVIEIRRLRNEGVFGRIIAQQFNVTDSLVYAIANNRAWKHIS